MTSALDVEALVREARGRGRRALLSNENEEALAAFCDAVSAARSHPELLVDLYADLARVCELDGRPAPARALEAAAAELDARLHPEVELTIESLRSAVAAARQDPEQRGSLGYLLFALSRLERQDAYEAHAALGHLEESAAIGLELDPDSLDTALRRAEIATRLAVDGDVERASAIAAEILARLQTDSPANAAGVMRTIAQARMYAGDLSGADADAGYAVRAAGDSGDYEVLAASTSVLGAVRQAQGDNRAATELLRRARELFGGASMPAAMNLARLGGVERAMGDLDASAANLTQAVAMLEVIAPLSHECGTVLAGLAATQEAQGKDGAAAATLRRAISLSRSDGERLRRMLRVAMLEKDLGRLDAARRRLTDVVAEAEELGDRTLAVDATIALGGVQRWSGELDDAQRLYESVLDYCVDHERVSVMSNIAGVAYERRRYGEAAQQYREAIAAAEAAGLEVSAMLVHNLATSLDGSGEHEAANAMYRKALAGLAAPDRNRADALHGVGTTALHAGRIEEAVAFLRDAVAVAETYRAAARSASRASVFTLMRRLYDDLIIALVQRGRPEDISEAFRCAELTRAQDLGGIPGVPGAAAIRSELAALARRRFALVDSAPGDPAVDALLREEDELVARLDDLGHREASAERSGVIEMAQAMNALEPGEAMLMFHELGDRMLVWTLTSAFSALDELDTSTTTLAEAVVALVVPYHGDADPHADEDVASWRTIAELVIDPVRDRIATASRLVVCPAGPLHYIPFEPLVGGQQVAYVPSATIGLTPRRARVPKNLQREFVGLGDPAYDETLVEFAGLPRLPGAALEVQDIARRFGERGLALWDARATERELRHWARRARYLHIAAHAVVDVERPMSSAIVLASAGLRMTDLPQADDLLHAYEIIDIAVASELVVCAACRSGFGADLPGEGMASLGSAFLRAGARWVLVTLWPVGDIVTAAFMDVFYVALSRGVDPPGAVAEAQADIRAVHISPYWWAGFVLVGAGR